jgi:broad specificity phosphatase PhoE
VLRRNEPETLGQLVERVDRVLGHIATAVGDDAVAVVVSHGHLHRVLTARWLGLPVLAAAQLQLLPASISRLTESAGHWSLTTWNSTPSDLPDQPRDRRRGRPPAHQRVNERGHAMATSTDRGSLRRHRTGSQTTWTVTS